jgi:hypothetical protein
MESNPSRERARGEALIDTKALSKNNFYKY